MSPSREDLLDVFVVLSAGAVNFLGGKGGKEKLVQKRDEPICASVMPGTGLIPLVAQPLDIDLHLFCCSSLGCLCFSQTALVGVMFAVLEFPVVERSRCHTA